MIDALLWHEDQRAGLGSALDEAVNATLAIISERPTSFPSVGHDVRRALTKQFSYAIYFRQQGEVIYVLAIIHVTFAARVETSTKRLNSPAASSTV